MAKISDFKPADIVRIEFEDYAGKETGEFINIRRIDSQAVRDRMHDFHEQYAGSEKKASDEEAGLALMVALIDSWSFDEEINAETVKGLCELYPRTATFSGVDAKMLEAAANKANFIKKKPATDPASVAGMEAGQDTGRKQRKRQKTA